MELEIAFYFLCLSFLFILLIITPILQLLAYLSTIKYYQQTTKRINYSWNEFSFITSHFSQSGRYKRISTAFSKMVFSYILLKYIKSVQVQQYLFCVDVRSESNLQILFNWNYVANSMKNKNCILTISSPNSKLWKLLSVQKTIISASFVFRKNCRYQKIQQIDSFIIDHNIELQAHNNLKKTNETTNQQFQIEHLLVRSMINEWKQNQRRNQIIYRLNKIE